VKYIALNQDPIEVICSKIKRYIELIKIHKERNHLNTNIHDLELPSVKQILSKNRSSSNKQVNTLKEKLIFKNTHVQLKDKNRMK